MKRFLAILLAACYLCLSTGITVNVHYCMGQRAGASLLDTEEGHQCHRCGMVKQSADNGCCKDKQIVLKAAADVGFTKAHFSWQPVPVFILPDARCHTVASIARIATPYFDFSGRPHGPPLPLLKRHILLHTFLI